MNNLLAEPSRGVLSSQIPQFQIKKSQVVIQDKTPAFIFDKGYKIAVIDIDAFPDKYANQSVPFVINKNSVFVFNGAGGYSKVMDFSDFVKDSKLLGEEDFLQTFASIHSRLLFTCFFIMLPIMFLSQVFLVTVTLFVLSGIVWGYGKFSNLGFKFKGLFRIALFSIFPALALDLLIDAYHFVSTSSFFDYYFKVHGPTKRNVIFLLSIGYFVFAVKSVVKSKKFK